MFAARRAFTRPSQLPRQLPFASFRPIAPLRLYSTENDAAKPATPATPAATTPAATETKPAESAPSAPAAEKPAEPAAPAPAEVKPAEPTSPTPAAEPAVATPGETPDDKAATTTAPAAKPVAKHTPRPRPAARPTARAPFPNKRAAPAPAAAKPAPGQAAKGTTPAKPAAKPAPKVAAKAPAKPPVKGPADASASGDASTNASFRGQYVAPAHLSWFRASDAPSPPPEVVQSGIDWEISYAGIGTQPVTREQYRSLMRPLPVEDIEVKPDGVIYLPEVKYRRRLNEAFGPMGWGIVPRGETVVGDSIVTREYALVVNGRFVAQAQGYNSYFGPDQVPAAVEGAKSNALMRCCKDLGVASDLWDPSFIRWFRKAHMEDAWVEHQTTKKKRLFWFRKGQVEVVYPYKLSK